MPKADSAGPRKRRQRGSINAEDILAGAFEIARSTSVDELSMPILAKHLDVGVTSIYWYFRKKEELLNAMTDIAVDKYARLTPEVRADDTWQHVLIEHFTALRDIHREDEVLSDLMFMRTSTYSRDAAKKTMQIIESVVAKLVADGFTPADALKVHSAIGVYTRGSIIHDRVLRLANAPTVDPARQRKMTDWSDMPVLNQLIDQHAISGTSDEDFEFGIAGLIAGFEVLLAERKGGRAASARRPSAARSGTAERAKAATTRKSSARRAAG
ncbi:TetR/AcrR family transcriptional regulator [Actinomadura welshii]|uniref:TetR/AcrR family transcriptional regulator n=1 Tax=Actinomadura welshii TaxID=3103817 RepID=UPI0003AD3DDE|nr:TetR/AcrR family transcriptional regulator C-terminal domain-containing protein [Actinomadura madurae]